MQFWIEMKWDYFFLKKVRKSVSFICSIDPHSSTSDLFLIVYLYSLGVYLSNEISLEKKYYRFLIRNYNYIPKIEKKSTSVKPFGLPNDQIFFNFFLFLIFMLN